MVYSLYDGTVGMAKGALTSLNRILTQAEQHPNAASFFTARLIDDMKPLTFQVHYAAFSAQAMAAKLASKEDEYVGPEEKELDTYEKMHARVDEALKALEELEKESVNQVGEGVTEFGYRDTTMNVPVKAVAGLLHMPNVYFHVNMAYAILRKEGVPLGKRDWSRGFVSDYI